MPTSRRFLSAAVQLVVASLLLAVAASLPAQTANAPWLDPALPIPQRVHDLVSRMTLAEKVSQMQNQAAAIPHLGVPAYNWWSEALHGVARSGYATVFPQAIGMAATWDAPLIHQEAAIIGIEARGKFNSAQRAGNHSIFFGLDFWSPNVNIFRDPRWGRGQETYGEDPFLTGQLATQFVLGLQGNDPEHPIAIATPKHFDVHSGPESERHRFNVNVSPHDLEDTYLPAFRAAIVDAHAGSIMCAYNAIDGAPACANKMLLQKILRGRWRFSGYVVSDCGAISDIADGHKYAPNVEQASVDAVRAGTDLSCGDEYATLVDAVRHGLIQESEIDTAVERLMTARFHLGLFDPAKDQHYSSLTESIVDSPQHAALNLRAAEESMVLLKNDGVLPLRPDLKTIAVIGPNASSIAALEGNYNGAPIDPQTPLAAFKTLAAKEHIRILDAQGSPYVEQHFLPVPPSVFHTAGREGLTVHYFSNLQLSGKAVVASAENIDADWNAASPAPKSILATAFSARWTGTFTPPAPGDYPFQVSLADCYPCSETATYAVWFDGKQVAHGTAEKDKGRKSAPFTVHFSDARPHRFRLQYTHQARFFGGGLSLDWQPPVNALRSQAVDLARKSDLIVAAVGITPHLEGEEMPIHIPGFAGGDRTSIDLPQVQQQLLHSLAATGKPLVVVLMNGSALAVDWTQQQANAILEAWYPGARGGQAVLNTLLGSNNPAGRLPLTFYASNSQLPPFDDYSMANRTYRYFRGQPLYGFGYGLSYSHFSFSHLHLSSRSISAGESVFVTVDVTNTSKLAGDEVAELYIEYPQTAGAPIRALAGFTRIHLDPGATKPVSFTLNARALSHVESDGQRIVSAGGYKVYVGGSQPSSTSTGLSSMLAITGQHPIPQ